MTWGRGAAGPGVLPWRRRTAARVCWRRYLESLGLEAVRGGDSGG